VLSLHLRDLQTALPTRHFPADQGYFDADYTDQQEVDLLSCVKSDAAYTSASITLAQPCAACFHPSMTLFGRNVSVLVGTAGGDIVKFNMDYISASMKADVVYPLLPFVDRELLHPSEGPPGFLLTGCVEEKRVMKGNRVFREVLRGHSHRVLAMGVLGGLSDTVLSVDQSGLICEWKYCPALFTGNNWFGPSRVTRVSLRKTDLLPFDLSTGALSALPCTYPYRENATHQHNKSEGSVSAMEDVHSGSKETPIDQLAKASSSTSGLADWSSANRDNDDTKCLESVIDDLLTGTEKEVGTSTRRNISVSPPTDEEQSGLRILEVSSGPDRVLRTAYHPKYSPSHQCWIQHTSVGAVDWEEARTLLEVLLQLSVVSCKLAPDGNELFLFLGARCFARGGQQVFGEAQGNRDDEDAAIVVHYLAVYLVESRRIRPPLCRLLFQGDSSPAPFVRDFCVGPITLETLTRMCFVLTRSRIDVFGAYTGQRLRSIEWAGMKLPFSPDQIAVCPSQQWVAVSAAGDARIAVWTISRNLGDPTSNRAGIMRRCEEYFGSSEDKEKGLFDFHSISQHATQTAQFAATTDLLKVAMHCFVAGYRPTVTHLICFQFKVDADADANQEWIVGHVWDAVTDRIDRLERHRHLSRLVAASSSAALGTVEPTSWPDPKHPFGRDRGGTTSSHGITPSPVAPEILSPHGGDTDDPLDTAPLMEKTARTAAEVRRDASLWKKKAKKDDKSRPQKSRLSISSLISKAKETTESYGEGQAKGQSKATSASKRAVKDEEVESFV